MKMKTIQIEGWKIQRNPKPIPDRRFDFDFWHDNHDGENGLSGTASSLRDALEQIGEIEEREFGLNVCTKCFDYYASNTCPCEGEK